MAAMGESERITGSWSGRVECGCGTVDDIVLIGTREVGPLAILKSAVGDSRSYYEVEGKLICETCEGELLAYRDGGQR